MKREQLIIHEMKQRRGIKLYPKSLLLVGVRSPMSKGDAMMIADFSKS